MEYIYRKGAAYAGVSWEIPTEESRGDFSGGHQDQLQQRPRSRVRLVFFLFLQQFFQSISICNFLTVGHKGLVCFGFKLFSTINRDIPSYDWYWYQRLWIKNGLSPYVVRFMVQDQVRLGTIGPVKRCPVNMLKCLL